MSPATLVAAILFGLAGFAANWFKLELFFNVDFLFGSFFVLLAVRRYGVLAGILAAAIAGSCTWLLWNHPWALLTLVAEALCVGLLARRGRGDLLTWDILFWLFGGTLLVPFFYHYVMHIPSDVTFLIALKQGVNGVFNALLAQIVLLATVRARRGEKLPTLQKYLFTTLLALVMFPALADMIVDVRGVIQHDRETAIGQVRVYSEMLRWDIEKQYAANPSPTGGSPAVTAENDIGQLLRNHAGAPLAINATLIDARGQVVTTSRYDLLVAQPFHAAEGEVIAVAPDVAHWVPYPRPGSSIMQRWRNSFFYATTALTAPQGWQLRVEVPVTAMLNNLTRETTDAFVLLAALIVLAAIGSHLLSYALTHGLIRLRDATLGLPQQLGAGGGVQWPRSRILEVDELSGNFRQTAEALSDNTRQLQQLNAELVTRVQEAEKRYRILSEQTSDYVYTCCRNGDEPFRIEWLSGAVEKILGYSVEEVMALGCWLSLVHANDRETVGRHLLDQRPGDAGEHEFRIVRRDGTLRVISERSFCEADPDRPGRLRLYGASRDVTAQRQTEEALRQNRQTLASILNSVPQAIFWKDRESVYLGCNAVFARAAGVSAEEIIGKSDFDLPWTREQSEAYRSDDLAVMASREAKLNIQEALTSVDGQLRWIETCKIPLVDATGEVYGVLGVYGDVSERRRFEESLLEARKAAEAANQAKSEFLANMSHEIRTPMSGIVGMTQLLRLSVLDGEQQECLDAIELSAGSLLALINDILDLAKIEAGKVVLENVDFSLRQVVNDVVTLQLSRIRQKQIDIVIDMPAAVPDLVMGDALRFKQILLNLLANAVKFTDAGRIVIAAAIGEWHGQTMDCHFQVRDSGIGMSAATLERIFAPFEQGDASTARRFGGTGLGLPICRHLVELMGGRLWAHSTEGRGSTFHFVLPLATRKGAAGTSAVLPQVTARPPAGGAPALTILVAEDNATNLHYISLLLKKYGHRVIAAADGREAVAAWEREAIDLVLMDIRMPEVDGIAALAMIRKRERTSGRRTPVIAFTAHALQGDYERLMAEDFDGYVTKPVKVQQLLAEMARVTVPGGKA